MRLRGASIAINRITAGGFPGHYFQVITRRRLRTWKIPAPLSWLAALLVWKCDRLHRRDHHIDPLPTVGRSQFYDVRCMKCGAHYQVEQPRGSRPPKTIAAWVAREPWPVVASVTPAPCPGPLD